MHTQTQPTPADAIRLAREVRQLRNDLGILNTRYRDVHAAWMNEQKLRREEKRRADDLAELCRKLGSDVLDSASKRQADLDRITRLEARLETLGELP